MSTLAASATPPPSGLLIDPTKQAEYPILLGDKLSGKDGTKETRFINITYNHKSKSATPHQRSVITRSSSSPDIYKLTVTDKAGNAEQTTLTYSYEGSVDPASPVSQSDTRNLVLVFDPARKAFILEPVSSQLNFNLRSAPGKTEKQVSEQYPQLPVLHEDDQPSADEPSRENASEDEDPGAADESNPYDFRHFLPKANAEAEKNAISSSTTPDPHNVPTKVSTPSLPATKPPAPSIRRSKPQTNPLRQQKRAPKPAQTIKATEDKPKPEPASKAKPDHLVSDSAPSDEEPSQPTSAKPAASPNSNIIIDGDLIIDMGSPPPSRKPFIVNPTHFSSNNTSANEADDDGDDEEDIEDLRLPSPASPSRNAQPEQANDEVEDDDALAAEMEAAFEESAREEEARRQQQQYAVASDDESEVSEEE
ncbi:RNA polymerase II transcription elongation factor-domain-containing protein [Paecilomyces variotii]|uniref:RNA polymerase II transcription elongation factor-domain-containing protein n=1 Tax=Byssochlamys spectabilis TaxID=264951 RepID=A0A443I5E7_BYSSP|nr:RNA polymerase II transcription elongation factor-domain-containing protein [Paecilomyces variotii]KAJ9223186.1 hypothetical protein DTO169C6_4446 [Paecilomyces variotii]KAJ9354514.1 hypothetical protein DTO280E4_6872 [Paecilomyces variotii]RWQ99320.1 RNA polymerase II transcription elongation factor-domain-containing protein [Paecilomyces variotii]